MIRLILFLLVQALVVLYIFPWINPEFRVNGGLEKALLVVILFILLNWILRRLFVIFTLGIGFFAYYLSLGLLGLVANAFVLILIDEFFNDLLRVPTYTSAFIGGLILALISIIVGEETKESYRKKKRH
jgi:putative membrane protein